MYDALDEKQKQITFQKIIKENVGNDHHYLEEINLFLYDLQFQPNKETMNLLQKNNHQDILERIEKRDIFFSIK